MIETQIPKSKRPAVRKAVVPRLFFLDGSGGRMVSVNPDGSDKKVIVTSAGPIPDGIVVDAEGPSATAWVSAAPSSHSFLSHHMFSPVRHCLAPRGPISHLKAKVMGERY